MGKKVAIIAGLIVLVLVGGWYAKKTLCDPKQRVENGVQQAQQPAGSDELRDGDIIFQTSPSGQSRAIQLATHSKYSHCGIVYKQGDRTWVFEAVQPVKLTPLDQWIARGKGGHYVVKRLKDADRVLTPETLGKMRQIGAGFMGKDYDLAFAWSDDKMYCSELIWKIYRRAAGIELCQPEKLGDQDLTGDAVRQKLKERYGDHIPLDEPVISPGAIFDSEQLVAIQTR